MFGNTTYPVCSNGDVRYIHIKSGNNKCTPLILLHGMFGGLSNFDHFIQLCGRQRDIIVPEIPLYDVRKSDIGIPGLTDWFVENILMKLNLDKVVLLGNSLGGHIALDCALRNPSSVKGLILTGSSGLFEKKFGYSRPRRFDRNYIRERTAMTFYNYKVDESILDEIQMILKNRKTLLKLVKIARSTHEYNMSSLLAKIFQPCLLVWGKNDTITPPKVAWTFFHKLPNAHIRWIEECGHAPMMEKPTEFVDKVSDFLQVLDIDSASAFTRINPKDDSYEREESYT